MALPATMGRPVYRLYQLAWAGLDLLYPPHCCGCDKLGSRLCEECLLNIQQISESVCGYCGQVIDSPGICPACQTAPPALKALRAWSVFDGPMRKAVHRLKYDRDLSLAELFSRYMIEFLQDLNWAIDLITPVPIGKARLAERGYNQAALLALPLALSSKIPYKPGALVKTRQTRSQVGLGIEQRRANVAGAFQANAAIVGSKRVLIVDDVVTSGATMDACAIALRKSGADKVYGLALARTLKGMHDHTDSQYP